MTLKVRSVSVSRNTLSAHKFVCAGLIRQGKGLTAYLTEDLEKPEDKMRLEVKWEKKEVEEEREILRLQLLQFELNSVCHICCKQ